MRVPGKGSVCHFTKLCAVAEVLNRFTIVGTPNRAWFYGSGAMKSDAKLMLDKAPALSTATFKQRLSTIFYLTAITVSMIGWLSAFGWVTLAVARWLMA